MHQQFDVHDQPLVDGKPGIIHVELEWYLLRGPFLQPLVKGDLIKQTRIGFWGGLSECRQTETSNPTENKCGAAAPAWEWPAHEIAEPGRNDNSRFLRNAGVLRAMARSTQHGEPHPKTFLPQKTQR